MSFSALISELGDINKRLFKTQYYNSIHTTHSGEAFLLSCLKRHGGNATPAQLSRELDVSTARIAALLNKMEKKSLVERREHPENKKNTMVYMLPEGEQLHAQLEQDFKSFITGFFERIGEEKAKLYVELQAQMVNYMAEYKTRGGKN